MKKNLGMIIALTLILTALFGCSVESFFDVRSSMSPPSVSDEQISIENKIKNHLSCDFRFSYLTIGEKYSSVLKCNVGGTEYMVVFFETEDKPVKSHAMFFEKKSNEWIVKDDIVEGNFKVRRASAEDVNGDGFDEIIIEGLDINNSKSRSYIYQVQKNGIVPIP